MTLTAGLNCYRVYPVCTADLEYYRQFRYPLPLPSAGTNLDHLLLRPGFLVLRQEKVGLHCCQ